MTESIAPTTGRLVRRADLTPTDLDVMYNLMSTYFDGVTREQFLHDAEEKNWAILIERAGRGLVGFSTILAYETSFEGKPVSVVFSGDTIVAPEAWNTSALPRAWISGVAQLRAHYPRGRYVWLLITSGFRLYRFLPLFWQVYYPRCHVPTPTRRQRLLDHLATERFGSYYDPTMGIARFPHPQLLTPSLAGIPENRMDDPHVAFFAARNPGHHKGDELVCLTELSPDNLTTAGRRMARHLPSW